MVKLDIRDERLLTIVSPDTELEELLTGFIFTEGIVWHPIEHHLRFSDILGNSIYQWSESDGLHIMRPNSHLANGNTYDQQGRMLTCHHGTSRITRTEPDNTTSIIASHYQGKQLNSPNDLVVKSDGTIYFTDPMSGRSEYYGIPRPSELGFQGVYRVDPMSGDVSLLVDDFELPNGLCFSQDEKHLFVNDTRRSHIRVFDVLDDGTLSNGRIFAETTGAEDGVPDGMKIDSAGHLFTTGQGGIHIFDETGICLGRIFIPQKAANFCWGDTDLKTLYITASTSIYRVRLSVAGQPLFTA